MNSIHSAIVSRACEDPVPALDGATQPVLGQGSQTPKIIDFDSKSIPATNNITAFLAGRSNPNPGREVEAYTGPPVIFSYEDDLDRSQNGDIEVEEIDDKEQIDAI
jgi:hypothetical protein